MKTTLVFFLSLLVFELAKASEIDFFATLMRAKDVQGISDDVTIRCNEVIEQYEPESYICAFLLLDDEEFLRFIDRARQVSNLNGLWDIDRIIHTNAVLQDIELNSEVRTITKIENRLIDSVLNSSEESVEYECNVLADFYDSSDGYFRADLLYMLSDVYEENPEISMCFGFMPAFRQDFYEFFDTDLSGQ